MLLQRHESPEIPSERFAQSTPVSYALSVADRENVPFVIVCQGAKLRLYPARIGVGVGQRSRTETFIEAHTTVMRAEDLGYLWMLFSADALRPGGTFQHLLAESERFASDLAEHLRTTPPDDLSDTEMAKVLDAVESPWSRREENALREVFEGEYATAIDRSKALVFEIKRLGIEPFRAPEPLPPIQPEDVHLVAWMAIEAEAGTSALPGGARAAHGE